MEVDSELDQDRDVQDITEEGYTIAEGFHKSGDRRVEIEYVYRIDSVEVVSTYFENGEQFFETSVEHSINSTNRIDEGFWYDMKVGEFVENHFYNTPEEEVDEIFDDMKEQAREQNT